MKILLLGARGLIGSAIFDILVKNIEEIVAPSHGECDVTNQAQLEIFFERTRPDVVINATGYTAVDKAETDTIEKEKCYALNALAPRFISECAKKYGTKMVHISTDYVFDGRQTKPYTETNKANPLSVYGQAKFEGEKAVLEYQNSLVARTAWPFGPKGKNFVDTMLDLSVKGETLRVVNDQTGSPTYTLDFAHALYEAIKNDTTGIVHLVNSGEATWYELAHEIFYILGIPQQLEPISTEAFARPAPRPAYSVLKNTKTPQLRSWNDALSEYLFDKEYVLKA